VVNSTNLYCGTISTLTIVQHFTDFTSTATKRVACSALIAVLAVAAGVAGSGNFASNLSNYLNVVLFFLIPWTSINLLDFYVIRRGRYKTEDFFSTNGTFGRWGRPAIITYFVAFAVEMPFMHTAIFQGPIAKAMGGVDLAWLVGSLVSIPLYLYLAKRRIETRCVA
jgi:NCS1 family nucleobase:cation symporter-1